jgi:RND family efflux transporter MFP subunit
MNGPKLGGTLGLTVLALSLMASGCQEKHPTPVATPPSVVEVATPVEREVTDYKVFTARTQAVESVDVKPRVTGYLTKICFKDGDEVEEGKVLFEIDDRPYKAELDKAKGDVEFQKASLVKAQADLDIAQNTAAMNPGAISKQELSKRQGTRDEAAGSLKAAEATQVKNQLNYDWCKVTAPISGRVNRHFVDVGNLVTQDTTTLTNIVSLKPIWAYFDVDENTVQDVGKLIREGKLKSARTGEVPARMALGSDDGFPFQGTVDFVSNQLDPGTGSIRVRAVFPNKDGKLLAGMFGRVKVPVSAPHSALLVSDQAVGTNQGQKYVLVVNDQDEVEYRAVEVGQVHDGLREVYRTRRIDGKDVEVLKPTDRVIVIGMQRARPGSKVEPKPVDMQSLLPKPGDGPKSK